MKEILRKIYRNATMCDKHNLYTKQQAYKWYLCSAFIVFSDMLAVSKTIIIKPTQDVSFNKHTESYLVDEQESMYSGPV